jgi:hypothetical protein
VASVDGHQQEILAGEVGVVNRRATLRGKTGTLLFPNIEVRLNTGTVRGHFVDIDLLVSPNDPNHISELNRFLGQLVFLAFSDKFVCTPADLIRNGMAKKSSKNFGGLLRHLRSHSPWSLLLNERASLLDTPRNEFRLQREFLIRQQTDVRFERPVSRLGDSDPVFSWAYQ